MKTSELTGAALDWAVAKCEDALWDGEGEPASYQLAYPEYSSWWQHGGPIIERERIGVWPSDSIENMWAARPDYEVYPDRLPPSYGPTPLIAAMRCYVASKLGDTIDIPEELKQGESK